MTEESAGTGQDAQPSVAGSRPRSLVSQSTTRVTSWNPLRFPGSKSDAQRKLLALLLFFAFTGVAGIVVESEYRKVQTGLHERLENLDKELRERFDAIARVEPDSPAGHAEALLLETKFAYRTQLSTQNSLGFEGDDKLWFKTWQAELIQLAHPKPSDRRTAAERSRDTDRLLAEARDRAREILQPKYALVRHRTRIIAWYAVAATYLLLVVGLYKAGLPSSLGEPVFNILDVGFIGTIVQLTGGAKSWMQLLFVVSISLAVLQYAVFLRMRQRNPTSPHPALVTLPYAFALGSSYFWACSNEMLFQGGWRLYVIPSSVAILAVIVAAVLIYHASPHKFMEVNSS